MSWFLHKGTRIYSPENIKIVDVAITGWETSAVSNADPQLIGGKIIAVNLYPATDTALLNAIPTISSTWVITITTGSSTTVVSTAKVAVGLRTWNNV